LKLGSQPVIVPHIPLIGALYLTFLGWLVNLLQAGKVTRCHNGFQRHAADWAGAGALLHDFGVHGAGVIHILVFYLFHPLVVTRGVELWICRKLAMAFVATEMKALTLVLCCWLASIQCHLHATDRVCCCLGTDGYVGVFLIAVVIGVHNFLRKG